MLPELYMLPHFSIAVKSCNKRWRLLGTTFLCWSWPCSLSLQDSASTQADHTIKRQSSGMREAYVTKFYDESKSPCKGILRVLCVSCKWIKNSNFQEKDLAIIRKALFPPGICYPTTSYSRTRNLAPSSSAILRQPSVAVTSGMYFLASRMNSLWILFFDTLLIFSSTPE